MSKPKGHPKKATEKVAPAPEADPLAAPEAPVQPETPPPSGGALVEPPEEMIQRLSQELEQFKDRHLRLAAEFDNFRKRTQRERAEAWARAQAEVVASILETLDDLGRVAHLPESTTAHDVLAGIELVERKLLRELTTAGLERIGEVGEPFDPQSHEAVSAVPAPTTEQDHRVASVMQAGYRFAGTLLRPARVSVYVWQEPEPTDEGWQGS